MKKIRFLAVDPHWREFDSTKTPQSMQIPSAGLAYVIASAKTAGAQCTGVEHFWTEKGKRSQTLGEFAKQEKDFIQSLIEKARKDKVQVVLITTTIGTYHRVLQLIERFSEMLPEVYLILGGAGVTIPNLYPELRDKYLKSHDARVYTIEGEGEYSIHTAIKCLQNGESLSQVSGIHFRQDGHIIGGPQVHLPQIVPMGDYSDFDLSKFYPALFVTNMRGCPGQCTFCDERDLSPAPRYLSESRCLLEFATYMRLYGIRHFKFADSTFTAIEGRVQNLCKEMISEKLDVSYLAFARVKEVLRFSDLTMQLLYKSGCVALHFGFEYFDECLLHKVSKGYDQKVEAQKVVDKCRRNGIKVVGSLQLGFPGSTIAQMRDTVEFAKDLKLDTYNWHCAAPPMKQFGQKEKFGIHPDYQFWHYDHNIPANLFGECSQSYKKMFSTSGLFLGRHTPMQMFLDTGKMMALNTPYMLDVSSAEVLMHLAEGMKEGREHSEYKLFSREPALT